MTLDDAMGSLEDNEALLMDPQDQFNPCIVGTGYLFNHGPVAVYDIGRVLASLVSEGLTEEEAQEHFEYNVIGGWVGDGTPIFVHLFASCQEG
jgi:hypothetical protein